ncbi:TolC family protein [Alteromonas sp. a30]|uniref:TolC family protein n=1 Tax=Alteromonas sp. a30 TaxID=2730917 RepID=UPI00227F9863|nr:TolC family protein [Alteromonas sp. a30]MCY7294696.1 TolC family protein [Alteromonas sp. a30]
MRLSLKLLLVLGLCFLVTIQGYALTIPELVESIREHHPSIQAAIAKRKQAQTAEQRAQGEFDLRLEQESYIRTSGYYHGKYLSQSVVKPLAFANAELIGRYRYGNGDFPIYENELNTQTAGESSIGLKLSLLQNRDTDKRRLGLSNAKAILAQGLNEERLKRNKLIYDGIDAYLDWYETAAQVNTLSELVQLAKARRKGIESSVRNGDKASISLSEFETTLLSRQIALNEAQQKLVAAQLNLSYFWRQPTSSGAVNASAMTSQWKVPNDIGWPLFEKHLSQLNIEAWVESHPAIQDLKAELQLAENKARLAENAYLPKLDLEVKVARDFGSGSQSLDGTESYLGLNFSMPLERRKASAERTAAKAKVQEIEYQKQALFERLTVDIRMNLQQLSTLKQLSQMFEEQSTLAKRLAEQEKIRFDAGDSDQFLLNSREIAAGRARLSAIEAKVSTLRQELKLVMLTGTLEAVL